jgi:hypothetical protein
MPPVKPIDGIDACDGTPRGLVGSIFNLGDLFGE